jgi:hypothetical protein
LLGWRTDGGKERVSGDRDDLRKSRFTAPLVWMIAGIGSSMRQ